MDGRILAAQRAGRYTLKLEGDVRVTLCAAIEDYLQQMFADPDFSRVQLDLCETEGLDSTTLGVLARLALRCRDEFGFQPVLYVDDPSIQRLLKSMAFERIFDLREERPADPEADVEIPAVANDSARMKARVIEAHGTLMDLSEHNRKHFQELMTFLRHS